MAIAAETDAVAALDESGAAGAATIATGDYDKGNDPDVTGEGYISRAVSGGAVVSLTTEAYGADGEGGKAFALVVNEDDADSGLTLTDGSAISLVLLESGVVVGVVVNVVVGVVVGVVVWVVVGVVVAVVVVVVMVVVAYLC